LVPSSKPERRLRILLGDPPIDWDPVKAKGDPGKWVALRDTFPAELIEREVLAKHRRALVVFGNMHFQAILRGTVLGATDFSRYFPIEYSPMAATRFAIRDGKWCRSRVMHGVH
jgi:hypothetical protein